MVENDRENVENGQNDWENEFYFWSRAESAVVIGRRIKTASLSVVAFFVVVVVDAVVVVVDAVGVVVDAVGVVVGVTFRFVTLKIKFKKIKVFSGLKSNWILKSNKLQF